MKKIIALLIVASMSFTACGKSKPAEVPVMIDDKYNNYYEIFVGSFADSDDNGYGDFNGINEKLDYLNDGDPKTTDDLGITGIWLTPIMPSPSYHKYDITDYKAVDPDFGTMEDFENLIKECDARGIDVILDLVLNHTSAEHEWFVSAKNSLRNGHCGQDECIFDNLCADHNPYVEYYNFSETKTAGIKQHQVPGAKWYYECAFWDQMPDLNLDNPEVRDIIVDVCDFWMQKGVDGFRLDATSHYYRDNVTQNNEFINFLYTSLQKIDPDVYVVAEAWVANMTIASMYNSGIDSFFNFGFSQNNGEIVNSLYGEDGTSISTSVEKWNNQIKENNPDAIDAVFLTNHDNARIAGALRNDVTLMKMAAAIYQTMPGNTFIYYGEELGMRGSGDDPNKRQPFVWSNEDDAYICNQPIGTTTSPEIEAGLDEQLKDKNSLVNYYKELIRIRDLNPEIARGTVTAIEVAPEICAYKTEYNGETVYVIHNLKAEGSSTINLADIGEGIKVRNYLSARGDDYKIKGGKLTLPSYGTIIMK